MKRRHFLHDTFAAGAAAAATLTVSRAAALGLDRGPAPATPAEHGPARSADGPLRLNSNENALGPSEAARRAILDGLGEANRYTHPLAAPLRARLAAYHGVDEASVVLGNGSTEVLRMAVQAMAGPAGWGAAPDGATAGAGGSATRGGRGPRLVVADPTFEHVEAYAAPWGLELVKVPLRADHAHDIERMRETVRAIRGAGGPRAGRSGATAARPVMVYICNPNNPTGTLTPSAEVESWVRETDDVVFLVDEAYLDYVDHPAYRTALPLALERPNVVVVRTFSKVHGLAGLRLGYALAHPEAARRIAAYSGISNLNAMALLAAGASIGDDDHIARSIRANDAARRITYDVLDELGLDRLPSHTNFVLHRVNGELADYIRRMREAGIWVGRPFPPMLGHNRLSFGTPDEMARFADTLRAFRRNGWV